MDNFTEQIDLNNSIGLKNSSIMEQEIGLDDVDALRVHSFLKVNPDAAVPYVAMVSIALFVGTVGNVLIIGAYSVCNKVRIIGNEYVLNLAIADLFITAVADPLCIVGVTHGRKYFDERPFLCELVACLCLTACFSAFFNLGLITLNRYIYICHNVLYPKIFSRKKIITMCFGAWAMAFLMELPNFFGFGGHSFDMKNLQCTWMRASSPVYTMIVGLVFIATPLILMTIAYILIFHTIQKSKRTVCIHSSVTGTEFQKRVLKDTIKSARSIFVIVIAFIVCWTPYVVVILVDLKDKLPIHTHLYVTFLAHLHSSLTATIYAITNPNFRHGYLKFLQIFVTRKVDQTSKSKNTISVVGS